MKDWLEFSTTTKGGPPGRSTESLHHTAFAAPRRAAPRIASRAVIFGLIDLDVDLVFLGVERGELHLDHIRREPTAVRTFLRLEHDRHGLVARFAEHQLMGAVGA